MEWEDGAHATRARLIQLLVLLFRFLLPWRGNGRTMGKRVRHETAGFHMETNRKLGHQVETLSMFLVISDLVVVAHSQ